MRGSSKAGEGLATYLFLYVVLFCGWGVLSPFLPVILADHGATPEQIGALLAVGIAVRLVVTPFVGSLADRLDAPRQVLGVMLLAAAASGLCYGLSAGFAALLLIGLAHGVATGPIGPLPDALAVRAAGADGFAGRRPQAWRIGQRVSLDYGFLRGVGAAAFIASVALAGQAVAAVGSADVVLWLNAALFTLAACAAFLLPPPPADAHADRADRAVPGSPGAPSARSGRLLALFRIRRFRRLLIVSGLIQGSHAFYASFATLHWQAAGLGPGTIGLLWSIAVTAEVLVFMLLGRVLLRRLGPAGLCALAASAGALRWAVMAGTAWLPAMILVQPLHGLTFAAQHLAAMAVLAAAVPARLTATAQSAYTSFGTGLAGAAVTLAAGPLYASLGGGGYAVMAALSALAVPAAFYLRAEPPLAPLK